MGIRMRGVAALVLAAIGLTLAAVPAGSAAAAADYVFPSTNEINTANGFPHVNEVSTGLGTVTLEFVNTTNSLAVFEYRIDGQTVGSDPHPVVTGDVIHPTICVDGRTPPVCDTSPATHTFTADAIVEIRLALGGERDWDFDWTPFTVGQPEVPTSKRDCKRGGWEAFGFRNQGQCIKFVNAAGDKPHDRDHRNRHDDERDETKNSRGGNGAKRRG